MSPGEIAEKNQLRALATADTQSLENIGNAIGQYNQIRTQYNSLLKEALETQDPNKRTQLMLTITSMNQQLTTIVTSLQQMYQENQDILSSLPPVDFQADLQKYKSDLEDLIIQRDELTKLNTVYSSIRSGYGVGQESSYLLYIIGILLMMIVLLMMFTFTALMPDSSSILSSLQTLPTLPTLPTMSSSPTMLT
jgi:hypothetical protein